MREVIDAAVEQGGLELSGTPAEAVAQLTGPLFHQHVMLRARITDELITATVDGLLSTHERPAIGTR
jgi:hypothetical protein